MTAPWRTPLTLLFLILSGTADAQVAGKTMAVTMDDLPLNTASRTGNAELERITTRLLGQIRTAGAPVTAFVNEGKLEVRGRREAERVKQLKRWLDAGIELGNHTFAHKSQNDVSVEEAKEDIRKGKRTIDELYAARGTRPHWFRHPYLQTGRDSATRNALTAYLDSLGYRIAPVTVDNSDWLFAAAYENAVAEGDSAGMRSIAGAYLPYMLECVRYYERMADTLFGRPVAQTLLMHANRLNGDHAAELFRLLRTEGYSFVTLDEALRDPAYASPDAFFGKGGVSWLHRWAWTRGHRGAFYAGEPDVPEFVKKRAGTKYD